MCVCAAVVVGWLCNVELPAQDSAKSAEAFMELNILRLQCVLFISSFMADVNIVFSSYSFDSRSTANSQPFR